MYLDQKSKNYVSSNMYPTCQNTKILKMFEDFGKNVFKIEKKLFKTTSDQLLHLKIEIKNNTI